MTLKLIRPAAGGWLERALGMPVEPISLTLNMPDIPVDRVVRGDPVRLRTGGTRS